MGSMAKNILNTVKNISSHIFGSFQIIVDPGTSVTRIGIFDKGIVLREPTYIGLNTRTNEYLFYGGEAKEIYGKAPNFIHVTKPIEHSIISDFDTSVLLMKHFIEKSVYPFFLNQRFIKAKLVCYSVAPSSATEVEQKALTEALSKTGISEVFVIEKSLATAAGANLPIFSKTPFFLVDMGGGLIEISVVVMGGIVAYKALKMAGEQMDRLIYNYLHLKNGLIIGEQTSEQLKIALLNLTEESAVMTVRGKSLEDGLPKSVRVKSADIKEALINNLNQIVDNIKELMETVPPEIVDGIVKNGLIICGGMANIKGLDRYMSTELKIPVSIPDSPQDATSRGLLRLLNDQERLNRLIMR